MEHKQGVDGETMVDRISDLPDEVSLHILSFLAITDVLHFGRVSKRCGQLHLLTPSLKFDGFSNLLNKKLRLLISSLNTFMIRRGDLQIQTFLLCRFCSDDKSRIINWIHNALRCNVEALVKEGTMAAHLENVCYLHMAVQHFIDDLIPAIVSRLPNLSTLYINSYGSSYRIYQSSGFDAEYWKSQNPAFVNQLEEVTIELSDGSNEIESLRYMLQHAQNLKKIVIVHTPEQSDAIKMLHKIREDVQFHSCITERYIQEEVPQGNEEEGPKSLPE